MTDKEQNLVDDEILTLMIAEYIVRDEVLHRPVAEYMLGACIKQGCWVPDKVLKVCGLPKQPVVAKYDLLLLTASESVQEQNDKAVDDHHCQNAEYENMMANPVVEPVVEYDEAEPAPEGD
jgi:hypothetical protein